MKSEIVRYVLTLLIGFVLCMLLFRPFKSTQQQVIREVDTLFIDTIMHVQPNVGMPDMFYADTNLHFLVRNDTLHYSIFCPPVTYSQGIVAQGVKRARVGNKWKYSMWLGISYQGYYSPSFIFLAQKGRLGAYVNFSYQQVGAGLLFSF